MAMSDDTGKPESITLVHEAVEVAASIPLTT